MEEQQLERAWRLTQSEPDRESKKLDAECGRLCDHENLSATLTSLGLLRRDTVVVTDLRGERHDVKLHTLREKPGIM